MNYKTSTFGDKMKRTKKLTKPGTGATLGRAELDAALRDGPAPPAALVNSINF